MIDTAANAQAVVDLLNSAFEADPDAIKGLFNHRSPCNKALADHPTVIVGPAGDGWDVGFLGVVNALFGPSHRVARVDDDDEGLTGFRVVQVKVDPDGQETRSET